MRKVIVIGTGFSGLSAATCLAAGGFDVTMFEKNACPGGRARKFESGGFIFDMGPSWYWMPDVFEKYFHRFGQNVADYYDLKRLDPSYRIYYGKHDFMDVPAGVPALCDLFERFEPGGSKMLLKFLQESGHKYAIGINDLVYRPGLSWKEFADFRLLTSIRKLSLFKSHAQYVRRFFRHPRLIHLLEFPVLFLGAAPGKIPALYSLMNYADMALGTWYPMGGMHKVIEAMVKLALQQGVSFKYNHAVTRIAVNERSSKGVWSGGQYSGSDFIVAGADYRHVENDLLPEATRQYSNAYWNKRILAPSCLIFYVGTNKRIGNLLHHTLFCDQDFDRHLHDIYEAPRWPAAPQFYVCCPSKTDPTVAPPGGENLFILIPVAVGLKDEESTRDRYFTMVVKRIEEVTGENIAQHIVFKKSYAHNDFIRDYNAFKGNAYGLANTLLQTANFKPAISSKKLNNFFFTGQMTVPGPGIPPSIISGQVAADVLMKRAK